MPINSKIILKIVGILTFFIISSCSNTSGLNKYFVNKNQNISKNQSQRLSNYLNGEFYSHQLKRVVFAYPLVFLISTDGAKSLILACNSTSDDCNLNIQIYQQIKKFKRTKNIDLKILALNKKVLNNNFVKKKNNHRVFLKDNEDMFYDLLLHPEDNCNGDDC